MDTRIVSKHHIERDTEINRERKMKDKTQGGEVKRHTNRAV
jgi:hypothetical protein